MPRSGRKWAAGLVLALVASGAGAQLVRKPATVLPQLAVPAPLLKPGDSLTKPIVPQARVPLRTVRTTLDTARIPRLSSTIERSSNLVLSVVGSPLQLRQPLITNAQTLLAPNLARTDLALNRVNSWRAASTGTASLIGARAERIAEVARSAPLLVERDFDGNLILRGRILVIDPAARPLARARTQGFTIVADLHEPTLGLRVVTLAVPRGLGTLDAMRRLRAAAPGLTAEFDHLYEPAGGTLGASTVRAAKPSVSAGLLLGMIDGGVAAHPALAGRVAEQRGFAGPARASGHGTAIASLLVGADGAFRAPARGASLLVADVYGGNRAAGSASRMAQALGWLASRNAKVVNISLVGPPNRLVERAIQAVRRRGIQVVAAVGNDGPAAPPQYPASYPSVVAVTGVDARGVPLLESSNAVDLDFAAPGADMAAARPGRGYTRVRGTSFAAALAAGRLAVLGSPQRLAAEARPAKGRVGRGIVCAGCRIDPRTVGAK